MLLNDFLKCLPEKSKNRKSTHSERLEKKDLEWVFSLSFMSPIGPASCKLFPRGTELNEQQNPALSFQVATLSTSAAAFISPCSAPEC